MGHLKSRLDFAENQYKKILSESKKSKRRYVTLKFMTGVELIVCLGGFFSKNSNGSFYSIGYKDIISIFPYQTFFWLLLGFLTLLAYPLSLVLPFSFVLVYYGTMTIMMFLFSFWFSNEKRSKLDNYLTKLIPKLYPLSLHFTLKSYRTTTIHELVHFYDKRLNLFNYNNFKSVSLGSKDKNYYNKVTEINAHLVAKVHSLKSTKFNSFESFYKKVSKIEMFNYLTDENKNLAYKYLDEYYHEISKEN